MRSTLLLAALVLSTATSAVAADIEPGLAQLLAVRQHARLCKLEINSRTDKWVNMMEDGENVVGRYNAEKAAADEFLAVVARNERVRFCWDLRNRLHVEGWL